MAVPPDQEPDEFLQELARDLMQAIGGSLHQSEQVQRIVEQIETHGYHVSLVLAALTRLVKRDEGEKDSSVPDVTEISGLGEIIDGEVEAVDPAEFDQQFLRMAGIKGDLPA